MYACYSISLCLGICGIVCVLIEVSYDAVCNVCNVRGPMTTLCCVSRGGVTA